LKFLTGGNNNSNSNNSNNTNSSGTSSLSSSSPQATKVGDTRQEYLAAKAEARAAALALYEKNKVRTPTVKLTTSVPIALCPGSFFSLLY